MSIKQKYLKDENGEVFSPITSADSVIVGEGRLADIINNHCSVFTRRNYTWSGTINSNNNYTNISSITNDKSYNRVAIIMCYVKFNNNGNGDRAIALRTSDNREICSNQFKACATNTSRLTICYPAVLVPDEKLYVGIFQDSGSSLTYEINCKALFFDKDI